MNVFVDHTFKKGFFLDEERIRRINEILVRQGKIFDPETCPEYEVFRADSIKYTTADIDDVIKEKNIEYQKIIKLHITMKKEDEIDLDLLFDDEGWSTLVIEGNDKDRVFILFSDLREYIQNEVCTIRSPKKISANFIQMILIMGLLIAVIFSVSDFLGNQQTITMNIDEAIASQDVIEKLNYLLSAYSINSIKFFDDPGVFAIPITFVFVIFLLFFDVPILKFVRYFFPSHLFLFGKEIERNVRRKQLLNNILWVVIIGGIISAITGLVLK